MIPSFHSGSSVFALIFLKPGNQRAILHDGIWRILAFDKENIGVYCLMVGCVGNIAVC